MTVYVEEACPERRSIEAVIDGLIGDLEALRAGRMTIRAAEAHALIAKQIFNGLRLSVVARRSLEGAAQQIAAQQIAARPDTDPLRETF